VLRRVSERLKDRFDVFGGLPDVIDDDWIEDAEEWERKMDEFIRRNRDANAFDLRYGSTMEPEGEDWTLCSEVLARSEVERLLFRPW
jgi:hypothetical protein